MDNPKKALDVKKYILVFLITSFVFVLGFWLSNIINSQKLSTINALRQELQLNVLSTETQFSILETAICENSSFSTLASELYEMGEKLSYMESRLGQHNPDVLRLKKYYSLLEIKNWLLVKKSKKECKAQLIPILYFYSNRKNCPTCAKQGFVLTYLRNKYPFLRIYSFDYDLNLSAIDTIKSLYSLKPKLPIIIVGEKVYYGFKDKDELEKILPKQFIELKKKQEEKQKMATSSPTTTLPLLKEK